MPRAYIGLGSNLADPETQIMRAFSTLSKSEALHLVGRSFLYRSAPLGPPGQPDYINAAARVDTALAPEALLDLLQAIENNQQRERRQRWGPRTLDLDLLLYDELCLHSARLTLPHPELTRRNFVLQPLLDIDPELRLPDGRTVASILHIIGDEGLTRIATPDTW